MAKQIVHIGLGKAASTTLQRYVFPEITKNHGFQFIQQDGLADRLSPDYKQQPAPFRQDGKVFASFEGLVGPDPRDWNLCLEKNLAYFGRQSTIMLIIRKPSTYMKSIFQQVSHHSGIWIRPEDYFVPVSCQTAEMAYTVFDPTLFNQKYLIEIYAAHFDEVIVQKFETLKDLRFLSAVFDLNEKDKYQARENLQKRSSNRSFSKTAVNLSLKIKGALGKGCRARIDEKRHRTLRFKLWRAVVQRGLDRLYPYKKFEINWQNLSHIDVASMDAAYSDLPDFQRLVKGAPQDG